MKSGLVPSPPYSPPASLGSFLIDLEGRAIQARTNTGLGRVRSEGRKIGRPPFGFEYDPDHPGVIRINMEQMILTKSVIEFRTKRASYGEINQRTGIPEGTVRKTANGWEFYKGYPLPS